MAKRAASAKPKKSIADERTPEERFDDFKVSALAIAKAYKKNAKRPDKVADLYIALEEYEFFGMKEVFKFIEVQLETYDLIIKKLEKLEYEDLIKEEYEDPFKDMLVYIDINSPNEITIKDVLLERAKFEAVRPFGEMCENKYMELKGMLEQ